MIETICRLEFPDGQKSPDIRNLSQSCDWKIDSSAESNQLEEIQGFTEQELEPSPLDELANLELTEEEKQVETDAVAAQQYRLVEVAAVSQSLGFSFRMHPMIHQYIN